MALDQWKIAEVTGITDETETTRRFFLKVQDTAVFNFKPGQFITVDLPIHEKKNKRWRSYSIASAPGSHNQFELVISYVPAGPATNYLWKEIREGALMTFRGPAGSFLLPEVMDTDICLIATGTGIAPYRSMLLDLGHHPRPIKNIHLVFGTRYLKDVLYRAEMESFRDRIPGFHFHLALSRESLHAFDGNKGYVHSIYESLFVDHAPAQFYLCGWRNMIDEAQERILKMGYDRKQIHVELYG